ncbi:MULTISPECIES: hypothetical protein [Fusobacterium]|mgnify:CR=1 FL=1|jgi:hypothetical protein|uniref:hypothetical protein n=1 Tax=Fusobacterium TaxID=848 RepID=UPI001F3D794C|nr:MULTISPECIES: hypothetical protein [Fusobacterium]MCF2611932.1 hypothetical protein [Fusobacterium perfoetens]MDY2981108.1 hypothetical protein [Fusobacterium sp.]
MKILIKNKKWNIFLGDTLLVCDVNQKEGVFFIKFEYGNKIVNIKSKNIDNTLKNLEDMFVELEVKKSLRKKIAG